MGRGTKIPQAVWRGQTNKQKRKPWTLKAGSHFPDQLSQLPRFTEDKAEAQQGPRHIQPHTQAGDAASFLQSPPHAFPPLCMTPHYRPNHRGRRPRLTRWGPALSRRFPRALGTCLACIRQNEAPPGLPGPRDAHLSPAGRTHPLPASGAVCYGCPACPPPLQ